jgi:transposase
LTAIAQELELKYRSVRQIWARYRQRGEAGLQPHYEQCGRASPFPAAIQRAALALKREHPRWGGGLIHLQLAEQFPGQLVPKERTLQRWFQQAGLQPARAQAPPIRRERAHAVHEVWEIDAKEQMRLADGSGTCVLTVTDEASGALLGAPVFPPLPLGAGSAPGGTASVRGVVCPLGAPAADPSGQRPALGEPFRSAAGAGLVVGGVGDRADLESSPLSQGECEGGAV